MKILQNIDLVEYRVGSNALFYLPIDRPFYDKKVKRIHLLTADNCPYSPIGLKNVPAELLPFIYFDAYDKNEKEFVKNLSANEMIIGNNTDLLLDRLLDFSATRLQISPNDILQPGVDYSLLLMVEYQTQNRNPYIEPTNSKTIVINPIAQKNRYDLKTELIYALKDKNISRIVADGDTGGYITMRELNGKQFNQLPLAYLKDSINTEKIWLDSLLIDFDNSFIETPNELQQPLHLTFFYE